MSYKTFTLAAYFLLASFGLLGGVALIYWPGLDGPFLLDDHENLRPLIDFDSGDIGWEQAVFSNNSGHFGRPVAMLTFALNVKLSGLDLWTLKYTNLAIHGLCGLLVLWLSYRLFGLLDKPISERRRALLAFLVASLWLVAPLNATTTLYIVQRMTQLSALFSLCGLLLYTIGRENLISANIGKGWVLISLAVGTCLPLALLSKETGALLPLLLFLLELFFFRFAGSKALRKSLIIFHSVVLGVPTLAALMLLALKPEYLLSGYAARDFTLGERILTESRILFSYVKKILLPEISGAGVYHDDYLISRSLLNPTSTLMAVASWIMVFIGTAVIWWHRHLTSPIAFGLMFFISAHALESSIFPLELVFEHRNYLPSFGILFGVVAAANLIQQISPIAKAASVSLLLAVAALSAVFTHQQAEVWASRQAMLEVAAIEHPRSPRVHADLSLIYAQNGAVDSALEHLDRLEELAPTARVGAMLQRIITYCIAGQPVPANLYDYANFSDESVNGIYTILALREINRYAHTGGCPTLKPRVLAEAISRNVKAASFKDSDRLSDFHFELAQLFFVGNDIESAIREARTSATLAPTNVDTSLLLAKYLVLSGRYAEGRALIYDLKQGGKLQEQHMTLAEYYLSLSK